MAGKVGINLVTLLFLLIPGVVGVKAFLRAYVKLDDLSRLDKLAATVMVGGLSLALPPLILNAGCWSDMLVAFVFEFRPPNYEQWANPNAWCRGGVLTVETLSSMPVVVIVSLVSLQSAIVGIAMTYLGRYANQREEGATREPKYIEQPWEYASEKTARERDRATVITTSGDEVRGTIHRIGAPSEDYDILLEDPVRVFRMNGRETGTEDLSAYSYHHYRDISQIQFHDLDKVDDSEFESARADAMARFDDEVDDSSGRGGGPSSENDDGGEEAEADDRTD